jgi:hypothetical protein
MALFIQPENQNILWEMVNKLPLCNTVFPISGNGSQVKEQWFREIIQECYYSIPQNITRNDLYKINRDVLSRMMKNLVSLSSKNTANIIEHGNNRGNNRVELNKQTDFVSQYNSMFEIQKPKPIDFSEKIDDDVITNMSELIENQRKMRELEIQEFSSVIKPVDSLQNNKININILEDVPIQSQIILADKIQSVDKKHVRFDLLENDSNEVSTKDFKELSRKIENLDDKITSIFNILQNIILDKSNVLDNKQSNVLDNKQSNVLDNKQLIHPNLNDNDNSDNIEKIKQMIIDNENDV